MPSIEDDRDWRLEVNTRRIADHHDKTANPTHADYDETLYCLFETWMQRTDLVAPSAAVDKTPVGETTNVGREHYPTLNATKFVYLDM
ncbi:MAG: hypothetical protein WB816_08150 [Methylocystis sp.]